MIPLRSSHSSLFQKTSVAMQWHAERQKLIAQNMANASIPGYQPLDLEPLGHKQGSLALAPVPGHRSHMTRPQANPAFAVRKDPAPDEMSLSNNGVSLEAELVRSAETGQAHALLVNQYKKTMNLFRLALGRRSGGSV